MILEKSLQILFLGLTFVHLFTKFYQNCCCGLGVKAFFSISLPEKLPCQLFCKKPCQIKSFSLITRKLVSIILRAGHTLCNILNALQLKKKFVLPYRVFLFHEKSCKKNVLVP
jgi:hypothetical protein